MDALTYLRFNISAFSPDVWATVHGANADLWEKVIVTIADSVHINAWLLPESRCTIGLQMILIPATLSQVIPLTRWARAVGVDYMQIKHCSDDERGSLGIDYGFYKERYTREVLTEAEKLSTKDFQVIVKWEKLLAGNERAYRQCFGPPFHLQISGSGVVAPCGMFFHPAYKKYWIGNLNKQTFKEIWESDRYWEVMKLLSSKSFNAQKACGCLCLQDATNQYLDRLKKGQAPAGQPTGDPPAHVNFI